MLTKPFLNKQFEDLEVLPIKIWANDSTFFKNSIIEEAVAGRVLNEKLRSKFLSYTSPKSKFYDPSFEQKLKSIAPYLFITASDKLAIKKQQLIEWAKSGKDKPTRKTNNELYLVYRNYTNKNSKYYDIGLYDTLIELRPDWSKDYHSKTNKSLILDLVRRGEPRPKSNTPLGIFLKNKLNKASPCHDLDLLSQIKNTTPNWLKAC